MLKILFIAITLILLSCKEDCKQSTLGDVSDKLVAERFLPQKIQENKHIIFVDSLDNELIISKNYDDSYVESFMALSYCSDGLKSSKAGEKILTRYLTGGYQGYYFFNEGKDSNRVSLAYNLEHIYFYTEKKNQDSIFYHTRLSLVFSSRNSYSMNIIKLKSSFLYDVEYELNEIEIFPQFIAEKFDTFSTPLKEYKNIYKITDEPIFPINHVHLTEVWMNEEDLFVQFKMSNGHIYWLKEM